MVEGVYEVVQRGAGSFRNVKQGQCVTIESITDKQCGGLKYKEITYKGEDGRCSVLTRFDVGSLVVGSYVRKSMLYGYCLSYREVSRLEVN